MLEHRTTPREDLAQPTPAALDYRAAAAFLSVSPTTLRRAVAAGELRATRVGRRVVFRVADLEEFLAAAAGEEVVQ